VAIIAQEFPYLLMELNIDKEQEAKKNRKRAIIACFIAVLWLCPDSVCIRYYDPSTSGTTQTTWKFLFYSVIILFGMLYKLGPRGVYIATMNTGKWALLEGILFSAVNYCWTISVTMTAAATTLVLYSAAPLWSAVIAYIILKEKITRSTLIAITFGIVAVLIVFIGSLSNQSTPLPNSHPILGSILGVLSGIFIGAYYVLTGWMAKSLPNGNIYIGLFLTGPLGLIVNLAAQESFDMQPFEFGIAAIQGVVLAPISFTIFAWATEYIYASEVALISLIEVIGGPLIVAAAGFEVPPLLTYIGQ
jgi:drug/metabolite transporter (DMT)-like permease